MTLTDSSQGGGGLFVHGWAHNLEISNNRIYNNQGTLGGGITIGQGEHPPAYIQSGAIELPGSCETAPGNDQQYQMPYCFNTHVNIHNNNVSLNSSEGDELFSSTPSGAGGIAITSGADYYQLKNNWVCGNMSSGDGGGVSQLGFVKNADIEHNTILFNQSKNPSIPTNGGGLLIQGAPDTDAICSTIAPDTDCPTGLGDGAGPGMVINANLIQGNSADAGAGGGLRLQHINGSEISRYAATPKNWYSVSITNNIISNNVSGWDGAGVSLQDTLLANFVNNTITGNDSTATSGTLFQTFRRDLASSVPPNSIMGNCDTPANGCTASARQPAGISVAPNSPYLTASYPAGGVKCPTDHPNCATVSDPVLYNNVLWHNRAFHIELGPVNDAVNQTSVVLTPQLNQTATGACDSSFPATDYWDIGIRGDVNATDHTGTGVTLRPFYSVLSENGTSYTGNTGVILSNPQLTSVYCNGSKVPPEFGGYGYAVPPGTDEGNVFTNHFFTLAAGATTDESNNWINMSWGPLAMTNMSIHTTTPGADPDNPTLANYLLVPGSPALDAVPTSATTYYNAAPTTDFYGNPRPDLARTGIDIGAIEYQAPKIPVLTVAPTSLSFGASVVVGTTSAVQSVTLTNSGAAAGTGITLAFTGPFSRATAAQGGTGTCGVSPFTLASATSCTINVVFTPTTTTPATGQLAITATATTVTGSAVALSGTGAAAVRAATVSPASLAFGNVANGQTSAAQTLTVTNTGNVALAGGTFTFGGGTGFARAGGTCAAALAVNASCTYTVVFTPAASTANSVPYNSRTLAIAYNPAATVTGSPVALSGTGVAMIVTPAGPLTFANVPVGTTSAVQTLTVRNASGAIRTLLITVSSPFTRTAGGCGLTLTNNNTCTIGVVYSPAANSTPTTVSGMVTITSAGFNVANAPVTLSGNSVAQQIAATLTPATWSPTQARNCPGGNLLQILACALDPVQSFTLTNTGNVPLTGITAGALSGTNMADFAKLTAGSTCGTSATTLAPGATCAVRVQFKPLTAEAAGPKAVTLSVTDAAGTQTTTITGTAN